MEHRLSVLLKLYLHSWLNTWLQWLVPRQLQDETRNISFLEFGTTYIRDLTVINSFATHKTTLWHECLRLIEPYLWDCRRRCVVWNVLPDQIHSIPQAINRSLFSNKHSPWTERNSKIMPNFSHSLNVIKLPSAREIHVLPHEPFKWWANWGQKFSQTSIFRSSVFHTVCYMIEYECFYCKFQVGKGYFGKHHSKISWACRMILI